MVGLIRQTQFTEVERVVLHPAEAPQDSQILVRVVVEVSAEIMGETVPMASSICVQLCYRFNLIRKVVRQ